MRSFASDGRVHALELGVALEQIVHSGAAAGGADPGYGAGMGAEPGYGAEPGHGFSQRIDTLVRRHLRRHRTDGDGPLSFDEFKVMVRVRFGVSPNPNPNLDPSDAPTPTPSP